MSLNDSEVGLSYFGARWYDASLGRFMGIDPKDYKEGQLHSFNRYGYGNNNPYKYVDPDGREALPWIIPTVIIIGGMYYYANPEQRKQMDRVAERVLEAIQPNSQPWNGWNRTVSWGPNNNQATERGPDTLLSNNPILSNGLPRGFWPGDKDGEEWGRRNGVGAKEGRGRFHGIKQDNKGKGKEKYGVNPETGDVVNPEGEVIGNLGETKPE